MLSNMKKLNYKGGQAVIVSVMFLLLVSTVVVVRGASPAKSDAQLSRELYESKYAAVLSEATAEDVSYRIRRAMAYDTTESITLGGFSATTTITENISAGTKTLSGVSSVLGAVRKTSLGLMKGDRVSFNYGIQVGNGGFTMANSSSVEGNVYANGTVTGAGNTIKGTVVSAGPSGLINNIHSTSSAYAHSITNSTVDRDIYYWTNKTGTTYGGSNNSNYADRATSSFPISDALIAEWESEAQTGGTYSGPCPYQIKTNVTIGPLKIPCDLEISNGAKVTLAGHIWVVGNISFKNNGGIYMASALGSKAIGLIADNSANRSTGSIITISNSTTFYNSGTAGSFIFLISGNTSSEGGGATTAIDLSQSASGAVILYTNHGKVDIGQSSQLKSVTGYLISMKNSATLIYDTGLASTVFDTGPGGSWDVTSWQESQ